MFSVTAIVFSVVLCEEEQSVCKLTFCVLAIHSAQNVVIGNELHVSCHSASGFLLK
jgi:hypothetical protein